MRFIIIIGILSWWVLWNLINAKWFLPYDENHVPIITNLGIALVMLVLGASAFLSIPMGYLYYSIQKYWRKRKLVLEMRLIYLSWLGLFILIISYLGIHILIS